MKNQEYYKRASKQLFDSIYSDGYEDGFKKAREQFGQHSRGVAKIKRASKEDVERWGIELFGWCECGNAIEGRWVGMANFCPWCGRVMDKTGKAED